MSATNTSGLNGLLEQVTKYKKTLEQSSNKLMSDLGAITKKFDVLREKKTKLNKMPATMFQNMDKSIMIVFDNQEDSDKFFGK